MLAPSTWLILISLSLSLLDQKYKPDDIRAYFQQQGIKSIDGALVEASFYLPQKRQRRELPHSRINFGAASLVGR